MSDERYESLPAEVRDALRRGRKIEAIKRLRELRGIGLRQAKEQIETALGEQAGRDGGSAIETPRRQPLFAVMVLAALAIATYYYLHAEQQPRATTPCVVLEGHYSLVGRRPGNGASYSGSAHIQCQAQAPLLRREVEGATVNAPGRFETASPGEGEVLRFSADGFHSSCLLRTDLDNRARLSCLWADRESESEPGLEAYFAQR